MCTTRSAAEFLYRLRSDGEIAAGIPTELRPESPAEAYAIQDSLVELLQQEGADAKTIGYKVACTNRAIQAMFGLENPLFGRLLSNRHYSSPAKVDGELLVTRCIEAEFAFVISKDVPADGHHFNIENIGEYIEAVLPAIEIVETHYENWTEAGALQLVADNAIHGVWIAGSAVTAWQRFTYATHPVQLIVDGVVTREGSGGNVLGNPLTVVCWLANELPRYGKRLRRGEYVTTGLTTEVYLARPGETLTADFGPLGSVSCVIS